MSSHHFAQKKISQAVAIRPGAASTSTEAPPKCDDSEPVQEMVLGSGSVPFQLDNPNQPLENNFIADESLSREGEPEEEIHHPSFISHYVEEMESSVVISEISDTKTEEEGDSREDCSPPALLSKNFLADTPIQSGESLEGTIVEEFSLDPTFDYDLPRFTPKFDIKK